MSIDPAQPSSSSFWRSQFALRPTSKQVTFDVAFGIALPVFCLYFDPIVFRGSITGRPLVGEHEVLAGGAIGLGLLSLALWLTVRKPPALLSGFLAGGALFASMLGLVLLPTSIIALLLFIGILGFAPFVTAFVFWRNAVRAFRQGQKVGRAVSVQAVVGLAVACSGPWALHLYVTNEVSRALEIVESADPVTAKQGFAALKRLLVFASSDRLVIAYEQEEDRARRERLADVYAKLTGSDIRRRLRNLHRLREG